MRTLAVLLVACSSIACGGGAHPGVDGAAADGASAPAPDGSPGPDNYGPCSPDSDKLKCDGNNALACTCAKQGAYRGIDSFTGIPVYGCDAYSWVVSAVCPVACNTTINPTSGCIASIDPVLECAQADVTCWNGNLTFCFGGYPLPPTVDDG
jgi:hypothetical protein